MTSEREEATAALVRVDLRCGSWVRRVHAGPRPATQDWGGGLTAVDHVGCALSQAAMELQVAATGEDGDDDGDDDDDDDSEFAGPPGG